MVRKLVTSAAVAGALMMAAPALAQGAASPVLDRIKERGVINMGHRETSVPFSYLDANGEPTGYHVEICNLLVEEIKTAIGATDLKVNHVPITSQTRIPLIANGTLDLACGSASNTLTRQQQVDYLPVTYIGGTRLVNRVGDDITEIEDLEGKVLALASGTTDERNVKALIAEKGLDIKITQVKDHAQAWVSLETGRVDAYANDGVILAGLINSSKSPADYEISGRLLSYDPYGIMVPRNDSTFRLIGTRMIGNMMRSGDLQALYDKWYNSDHTGLKVPMSPLLDAAMRIQALPE